MEREEVLVSGVMIAQNFGDRWSELLTSLVSFRPTSPTPGRNQSKIASLRCCPHDRREWRTKFPRFVSNSTQNRLPGPVIIDNRRFESARRSVDYSGCLPLGRQFPPKGTNRKGGRWNRFLVRSAVGFADAWHASPVCSEGCGAP